MQTGITAYDLLLSYPSDLSSCTSLLKSIVTEFNNHYGRDHSVVVRPVHWKDDAYPSVGSSPQDLINRQIADDCDLVLACFWTRFGSPTEGYGSGTEEEVERARGSGRQVFLYFIDKPVIPSAIDQDQYAAVAAYRKKIQTSALYSTAQSEESLAADFRQKLELYFAAETYKDELRKSAASKRVLWVDDRPENNSYVRTIMEAYGIEFSLALSTKEALRLLTHETYGLIISDMGRKEGPREGYVLLDKLRTTGDNTPLVFFASSRSAAHITEALSHGGQGCTNDGAELVELAIRILIGGPEV